MELRPGLRLRSQVCDVEVVVIRSAGGDIDLRCGGHPMIDAAQDGTDHALDLTDDGGTLLGKRYEHEPSGTELLCTRPGAGGLTIDGDRVRVKQASALPSSD